MKIKPIIGRVGGKYRLAPRIVEIIKQFRFSIYCEPFVGSAAVYFQLINDGIPDMARSRSCVFRAVLNDADRDIMNLYQVVRDFPEVLAYDTFFTPYSRAERKQSQLRELEFLNEAGRRFIDTYTTTDIKIEFARKYLVSNWQSQSGNTDCGGWSYTKDKYATGDRLDRWQGIPRRILEASPYLQATKGVYLECDDAIKCMGRWDSEDTVFFIDPPYINCENYYSHNAKQSQSQHLELHLGLAKFTNTCAGQPIISYYPHPLLDELYTDDNWDKIYIETFTSCHSLSKKKNTRSSRTELLLVRKHKSDFNPPVPPIHVQQLSLF